jgi:hypothetical protein
MSLEGTNVCGFISYENCMKETCIKYTFYIEKKYCLLSQKKSEHVCERHPASTELNT